jgi:hypothetical protein
MPYTEYDYGNKQIRLIPFICDTLDDLPFLAEHIAFRWLNPADLKKVDFSEADIIVAAGYLKECVLAEDQKNSIPGSLQHAYNEEDLRSMIGNLMGIKEAEWVAESAIGNTEILRKLVEYSFSDDKKLAFRASWTLS